MNESAYLVWNVAVVQASGMTQKVTRTHEGFISQDVIVEGIVGKYLLWGFACNTSSATEHPDLIQRRLQLWTAYNTQTFAGYMVHMTDD